jgi:hypothetical protein
VCPFLFTDTTGGSAGVCLYVGSFSQICGHNQLGASWLTNGQNVVAAITTDPAAFFRGEVSSGTTATLMDWATQPDFSDAQPLSGSITLAADGRLLIAPTDPPFSIDGCNFDLYDGTFNGVQISGGSAGRP